MLLAVLVEQLVQLCFRCRFTQVVQLFVLLECQTFLLGTDFVECFSIHLQNFELLLDVTSQILLVRSVEPASAMAIPVVDDYVANSGDVRVIVDFWFEVKEQWKQ